MNKVITINLGGTAYQLEEAGYEALRVYLENASRQLAGNPDRGEIIADIELAIGEKCRALLNAFRNVVSTANVESILAEMGPVEDGSGAGESPRAEPRPAGPAQADETPGATARPGRRLYRLLDGAMLAGLCNGIGVFLGIDPIIVRGLFVILTLVSGGVWILAYLVLCFIVPVADTPEERAAATGEPNTAEDFIRRAKQGYYNGMKAFRDKDAHRAWRLKFKGEMRRWRHSFHHGMGRMHATARQEWGPSSAGSVGQNIALTFLGVVRGFIVCLGLFAIISVLTSGTIFGFVPPLPVPPWAWIVILFVAIRVLAWPIKAVRYHSYYGGAYGPRGVPPFVALWDTLIWVGCVIVLFWLANRFIPAAHEALQALPEALREVANQFRDWWQQR